MVGLHWLVSEAGRLAREQESAALLLASVGPKSRGALEVPSFDYLWIEWRETITLIDPPWSDDLSIANNPNRAHKVQGTAI